MKQIILYLLLHFTLLHVLPAQDFDVILEPHLRKEKMRRRDYKKRGDNLYNKKVKEVYKHLPYIFEISYQGLDTGIHLLHIKVVEEGYTHIDRMIYSEKIWHTPRSEEVEFTFEFLDKSTEKLLFTKNIVVQATNHSDFDSSWKDHGPKDFIDAKGYKRMLHSNYKRSRMYEAVLPPKDLVLEDSSILAYEDLKGKIVFLNFWGMGCLPCVMELPVLDSLENIYKNDDRIVFIAVNTNSTKSYERNEDFWLMKLSKQRMDGFNMVLDPEKEIMSRTSGYGGIPAVQVFDRNGKVILAKTGYVVPGGKKDLRTGYFHAPTFEEYKNSIERGLKDL